MACLVTNGPHKPKHVHPHMLAVIPRCPTHGCLCTVYRTVAAGVSKTQYRKCPHCGYRTQTVAR